MTNPTTGPHYKMTGQVFKGGSWKDGAYWLTQPPKKVFNPQYIWPTDYSDLDVAMLE